MGWWNKLARDYNMNNTTPDRRIRDKTINRFELIDETGRLVVKYGVSVELLYQDDGRTLKVVLRDTKLRGHHES